MNAIASLFDDPEKGDADADEDDEDDEKDGEEERARAPRRRAAPRRRPPASAMVQGTGHAELPAATDAGAWERLAKPIYELITERPRAIRALRVFGSSSLPRFGGKSITEELIAFLVRAGKVVEFQMFDGKPGLKLAAGAVATTTPRRRRARAPAAAAAPPSVDRPAPAPVIAPIPNPEPPPAAAQEQPMAKNWISSKDAAELLGTHPNRLHQLLAEGRIESRGERASREWERYSIEKYLAERGERKPRARKSATPPPKPAARALAAKTVRRSSAAGDDLGRRVRWLCDGWRLGQLGAEDALNQIATLVCAED